MSKKKKKSNSLIQEILDKITPEQQAKYDALFEANEKWHEAHPDHGERYGTDRSYFLEQVVKAGFNPIGITVMMCEETFIFATEEETSAAAKKFMPEGWWNTVTDWEESRQKYVDDIYQGVEADAPKVYCLDDNYKEIIK